MVSAMNAIRWDLGNPWVIFKGSRATPYRNPAPFWLKDFQHSDKLSPYLRWPPCWSPDLPLLAVAVAPSIAVVAIASQLCHPLLSPPPRCHPALHRCCRCAVHCHSTPGLRNRGPQKRVARTQTWVVSLTLVKIIFACAPRVVLLPQQPVSNATMEQVERWGEDVSPTMGWMHFMH